MNKTKEPFIKLFDWMLTELKLKGNNLVLYSLLYSLSDDNGVTKVSNKYLQDKLNVDERTIQRWLDNLQKKNHINRIIFDVRYNQSFRIITVNRKNTKPIDSIKLGNEKLTVEEVLIKIERFFNDSEYHFLLGYDEQQLNNLLKSNHSNSGIILRYFKMKEKYV